MNNDFIRAMPKIDLHCHLDGSLPLETIRALAAKANIPVPESDAQLRPLITAPADCHSLVEYLACFGIAISCLQTAENLFYAAKALLLEVAKENVVYLEARFAPMLSAHGNLTATDIVGSVVQGFAAAKKECGTDFGAILCAIRNHPQEYSAPLLAAADRYMGQGVVALDLAGDEKAFPAITYRDFFQKASSRGFPFTIHAGEADGPESVRQALQLGAKRIGHGIGMKTAPALMEWCAKDAVGIEVCPVSNLQTKAAIAWAEYPLCRFMDAGLLVTVNTDNRTVSETTLTREFNELQGRLNMGKADMATLYQNAVQTSFGSDAQKKQMNLRGAMFFGETARSSAALPRKTSALEGYKQ